MTIDQFNTSTLFATVRDAGNFKGEEEILFSMHFIFRIGSIQQINGNDRLRQVDLILIIGNDPDLHTLTEYMWFGYVAN
ncbi:unnamed protein product [Rotaria sp. Silwood2]|nr:unnamed protein product [Rotaria sp. Silwood2]CAF2611808.1 unnamed protein product [Rotaria sp. Silwood2]CAF2873039.1 unnamed protein product [Rotaria sp. Silwood2]CAF3880351.1 unnamed protein product [Rotaria sp. Silwood2]CAF3969249.1 unnamed protein product [Rotaria sp. Silwood2]